ncbi:MAG: hypothetical protein RBR09_12140 [Desulfobulbaceae bacterium]|jgi:chromosome segregation ATPase|nr:hypothetical protein [Desulfobulbaceae bacterium]
MNKNGIIFILVVLTLIGSVWGSVANRKKIDLERELNETIASMKKQSAAAATEQEQVLGKTADLQESIVIKDRQIDKARKELVALRKKTQALEARLSGCEAAVARLTGERDECLENLAATREQVSGLSDFPPRLEAPAAEAGTQELRQGQGGDPDSESLRERLEEVELTAVEQQRLEAANARINGLEKIVVDKTEALDAAGRELDRLRVNMDVLLAKIADQQEKLRNTLEESHTLNLELASRNEELEELRQKLTQQPEQEP